MGVPPACTWCLAYKVFWGVGLYLSFMGSQDIGAGRAPVPRARAGPAAFRPVPHCSSSPLLGIIPQISALFPTFWWIPACGVLGFLLWGGWVAPILGMGPAGWALRPRGGIACESFPGKIFPVDLLQQQQQKKKKKEWIFNECRNCET